MVEGRAALGEFRRPETLITQILGEHQGLCRHGQAKRAKSRCFVPPLEISVWSRRSSAFDHIGFVLEVSDNDTKPATAEGNRGIQCGALPTTKDEIHGSRH